MLRKPERRYRTMADNDPNSSGGVGANTTVSATTAAMLNQPIVIDCGSSSMKAGFAGGTKPKVDCATIHHYYYYI